MVHRRFHLQNLINGMTSCINEPHGDKFRCPMCGRVYAHKAHRQCRAEGREALSIAILHAVTQGIETEATWQMYVPRQLLDRERIIGICLDCDDHNGDTCTLRGIRRRCQWLKSLGCVGFRDCERWIK